MGKSEIAEIQNMTDEDLFYKMCLISAEYYVRIQRGLKAQEELDRMKSSLDACSKEISKMFKLTKEF